MFNIRPYLNFVNLATNGSIVIFRQCVLITMFVQNAILNKLPWHVYPFYIIQYWNTEKNNLLYFILKYDHLWKILSFIEKPVRSIMAYVRFVYEKNHVYAWIIGLKIPLLSFKGRIKNSKTCANRTLLICYQFKCNRQAMFRSTETCLYLSRDLFLGVRAVVSPFIYNKENSSSNSCISILCPSLHCLLNCRHLIAYI